MGKRKHIVSDSESAEDEAMETPSEDEKPLKVKPKAKKVLTARKPVFKHVSEDEGESEEKRTTKKKKVEPASPKHKASTAEAGVILTDASGDKYIDLGKKRRATVRTFKGASFVDIREFYDAGGEEKPGKKGISLSLEQWETLKASTDAIDSLFAKIQKKT